VASVRHERVQEQIKQVASRIILYELKDPRDLRFAKIFYSVLGDDTDIKLTQRAIRHAKGHIQREIARNVRLRFAPEISFEFDESPRKSIELAHIIDEALAQDEQRKKENEQHEDKQEPESEQKPEPQPEEQEPEQKEQ